MNNKKTADLKSHARNFKFSQSSDLSEGFSKRFARFFKENEDEFPEIQGVIFAPMIIPFVWKKKGVGDNLFLKEEHAEICPIWAEKQQKEHVVLVSKSMRDRFQ